MDIPKHVEKFAKEQGWGELEFAGNYKGVDYYFEINDDDDDIAPTGLPSFIADNHGEVYIACGLETLELPF